MMAHAYGLSLIAVLAALSAAIFRADVVRPRIALAVGALALFFLGYVVNETVHPADKVWSTQGLAVPPVRAGVAPGEDAPALAPRVAAGVKVRPADQIAVDIFDAAGTGISRNNAQIQIDAAGELRFAGWAADAKAAGPCKALFVTVDQRRFAVSYGAAREDVASFFHSRAYARTGFDAHLSATTIGKGAHAINFECLAQDAKTLYVSTKAHAVTVE